MGISPVNLLQLQEWLPCASRTRTTSWAHFNILTHRITIKLIKHCLKNYFFYLPSQTCKLLCFFPILSIPSISLFFKYFKLFLNLRFLTVSSLPGSLFSTLFAWQTPLSLKTSTLKTVMNSFGIHWRWKKMAILPPLDYFWIFVKIQFGTCIWVYFWVPLISISPIKSHHCLV